MTKYYVAQLEAATDTVFQNTISVGQHSLTVEFSWDTVAQEQLDEIRRRLDEMAMADPIISMNGERITTYDYVNLYASIADVDEWVSDGPLPSSLRVMSIAERADAVRERIILCTGLKETIDQLMLLLRWRFAVSGAGIVTCVGVVQNGGWYKNQEDDYAFRFSSDRDIVGYNDLQYVKMHFEVYDER